jgi:hypothetical protein
MLSFGHALRQESGFLSVSEALTPIRNGTHHAIQVKRVLRQAGLTMVDVSAQTRVRFGEKSSYFIPKTFLYKQKAGITPHICQVAALSELTGYRFSDWIRICGFDFNLIPFLQLKIPNQRTIIVTPRRNLPHKDTVCKQGSTQERQTDGRYLYAKIGSRDAVGWPEVRPGSVVRADRSYSPQLFKGLCTNGRLWLVEHPAGITCCRVKPVGSGQIILLPNRPPLSPWPLHLPTQARILGLVDRKGYGENEKFDVVCGALNRETFSTPSNSTRGMSFSRLLRTSRCRIGLTFREAHKMTLCIAGLLQDRGFAIAAGLLSDYEAMNKIPRHIAKIISLCVVYGIDAGELLEAGGLRLDDSDRRPIITHAPMRAEGVGWVLNNYTERLENGVRPQ